MMSGNHNNLNLLWPQRFPPNLQAPEAVRVRLTA